VFRLRTVLAILHIDRAVSLGAMARTWSGAAGLVTMLLIGTRLTPEAQGIFYTFLGIISARTLAELAFSQLVTQFAAHEWPRLSLAPGGRIVGDEVARDRLAALLRIAIKWYGGGGLVIAVVLLVAGMVIFGRSNLAIEWQGPWIAFALVGALDLLLVGLQAFLDGCHQVARMQLFRLERAVVYALLLWVGLWFDYSLWALPTATAIGMAWSAVVIARRYGPALSDLLRHRGQHSISWGDEIWPFQWRLAISSVSAYVTFGLVTPVLFEVRGAVEAGRFGMTWSLLTYVYSISALIMETRAPIFGALVARRDYQSLDRLAWRTGIVTTFMTALGSASIVAVTWALDYFALSFASRLLTVSDTILLALAFVIILASGPMGHFMRAHKREPLVWVALTSCILCVSVAFGGAHLWGITGVAVGYLLVGTLWILPMVTVAFWRFRRTYVHFHTTPKSDS